MNRPGAVMLVMAAYVGACAKPVLRPPPTVSVKVGALSATNRDWSKVQVCFTEPQAVQADIDSMSKLLTAFVDQTAAPADASWSDENLALLEKGTEMLSSALTLQRGSLAAIKKVQSECRFKNVEQALELNAAAQRRIEDAPTLMASVKASRAVAQWRAQLQPAIDAAKDRCASLPKSKPPKPDCYYAFEDETGRQEWRFCDGTSVVAAPGAPASHVPAPETPPVKGKKLTKSLFKPDDYLKVASERAKDAFDRAPKLPPKQPRKADHGQPEPKDG